MASINVTITDATGSRRDAVELPMDFPTIKVIAAVVEALGLPLTDPAGQPISYRFHHSESRAQLRDEMTLADSGVKDGDVLRLIPEITAG